MEIRIYKGKIFVRINFISSCIAVTTNYRFQKIAKNQLCQITRVVLHLYTFVVGGKYI